MTSLPWLMRIHAATGGRDLADEPDGFCGDGVQRLVFAIGVIDREHGDDGTQDGHPVRVGGEALHHLEDFGGQGGVFGDLGMSVKFGLIGQAAVPKQINDFFIKGVGSEV